MSGRRDEPGPEERQELSREDARAASDDVRASAEADADAADEYDDEETLEEVLEVDQTELEELGLTLDDPHQPGRE
jgi:hypothetical protein